MRSEDIAGRTHEERRAFWDGPIEPTEGPGVIERSRIHHVYPTPEEQTEQTWRARWCVVIMLGAPAALALIIKTLA